MNTTAAQPAPAPPSLVIRRFKEVIKEDPRLIDDPTQIASLIRGGVKSENVLLMDWVQVLIQERKAYWRQGLFAQEEDKTTWIIKTLQNALERGVFQGWGRLTAQVQAVFGNRCSARMIIRYQVAAWGAWGEDTLRLAPRFRHFLQKKLGVNRAQASKLLVDAINNGAVRALRMERRNGKALADWMTTSGEVEKFLTSFSSASPPALPPARKRTPEPAPAPAHVPEPAPRTPGRLVIHGTVEITHEAVLNFGEILVEKDGRLIITR